MRNLWGLIVREMERENIMRHISWIFALISQSTNSNEQSFMPFEWVSGCNRQRNWNFSLHLPLWSMTHEIPRKIIDSILDFLIYQLRWSMESKGRRNQTQIKSKACSCARDQWVFEFYLTFLRLRRHSLTRS